MLPVSAAEAAAIAREFEAAMEPCNTDRLGALMDDETMLRRSMQKARMRADLKRASLKEYDQSKVKIPRALCARVPATTAVDLLRIRQAGADHRPLFRTHDAGFVDYLELELGKRSADAPVRVVDVFDFNVGEDLTTSIGASMTGAAVALAKGKPLDGGNMMSAIEAGDWREVRRRIAEMPDEVRGSKVYRIADLNAALKSRDVELDSLLDAFARDFPEDPALLLISIDASAWRKDVPGALAAIDAVDRRVGGDPYLDITRAAVWLLDPTPENARTAEGLATASAQAFPDLPDAWLILLSAQAINGNFAGAVVTLERLNGSLGMKLDKSQLESAPLYAAFVASPEFEAWAAKQ